MAGKEPTSRRAKKGNLDVLMIAFGSMSEEEVEKFRKNAERSGEMDE
ncbi:hypothetical protein [Thermococcus sp. MAR1]|nr:hypothetical protein [Thermococcus sp. MAR1]